MSRRAAILLLVGMTAMAGATPAFAHKLKVFATAIGASVEGRAYFVGGGAAIGAPVTLTDSAGGIAATATTQPPDGSFAFALPYRDDFIVGIDAQDGHVADFALQADRLAETLPAAPHATPASAAELISEPPSASVTAVPSVGGEAIEAAVARQVAPLTDQIDEMQSSIGLRDVLGGVGYVLGIFGLWALLARRKAAG